jgi:hypothetical protein
LSSIGEFLILPAAFAQVRPHAGADGEGDGVESKVPRGVPGVFPFVRHRDHVVVVHVKPFAVAQPGAPARPQGVRIVLAKPPVEIEEIVLLGSQHPGKRLAHYAGRGSWLPLIVVVASGEPGVPVVCWV